MRWSFSPARRLRARLVVLSDRRPAPGSPRTEAESAIEWALRENDGLWLVRHVEESTHAEEGDPGGCNGDWSVLAGVPTQPRASMDEWADYACANASYAERIIEMADPDGTVWINGHRWLLVASALRRYGHYGPIGLLLDVPFPAPARLEALPWRSDLIAALDQHDLIGFRTQDCADNFEACRTKLGASRPWVGIIPDGVGSARRTSPAEWVTGFLTLLGSAARRDPQHRFID